MDKFPKPYSFYWWLSLYDRVNNIKTTFFARCRNGEEGVIKEYTRYEELSKWIRHRLYLSHYNNSKPKESKNFKLAEKILRDNICKSCMDETLQSLVNTPKKQVIKAMIEFAEEVNND